MFLTILYSFITYLLIFYLVFIVCDVLLIFSIAAIAVQILIIQTNTEMQVDYRTIVQWVTFWQLDPSRKDFNWGSIWKQLHFYRLQ